MLRSGPLVALGVVHHIMVRGIERRNIFSDDTDREEFLGWLAKLWRDTQTACYAPAEPCALAPAHRANAAADSDAVAFILTEGRPSLVPHYKIMIHERPYPPGIIK
jgi:hypothetical protein